MTPRRHGPATTGVDARPGSCRAALGSGSPSPSWSSPCFVVLHRHRRARPTTARRPSRRSSPRAASGSPRGRRCGPPVARSRRWRRAWTFVALSTGLWLIGNIVALVVGAVTDVVFPSPADVFWVPALPMAIAALLAIPGRLTWRGGRGIGLDGILLAVALLYVTWELLLGDAYERADLGGCGQGLLLVYWVLDTLDVRHGGQRPAARTRRRVKGTRRC